MLRVELILLEAGIDFRRVRKGTLQDRRGYRYNLEFIVEEDIHDPRDLTI